MDKYFFLIIGLGGCVLLSSCTKRTQPLITDKRIPTQLGPAKHFDIPTPHSFSLAHKVNSKKLNGYSDYLRYNGLLSVAQVISFYKYEMERSGWEIADLSGAQEGFLYCSKPTKHCGIHIQPNLDSNNSKRTTLTLFISQKL